MIRWLKRLFDRPEKDDVPRPTHYWLCRGTFRDARDLHDAATGRRVATIWETTGGQYCAMSVKSLSGGVRGNQFPNASAAIEAVLNDLGIKPEETWEK